MRPPANLDGVLQVTPDSGGNTGASNTNLGPANPALVPSSGGLIGVSSSVLIPFRASDGSYGVYRFNPLQLDDNADLDAVYNFRLEEIRITRIIEIRGVKLSYRNLGIATLIVTVTCQDSTAIGSNLAMATVKIGSVGADKKIYTKSFDLQVTGENPQLTIQRQASYGPVNILKAVMFGDVINETL